MTQSPPPGPGDKPPARPPQGAPPARPTQPGIPARAPQTAPPAGRPQASPPPRQAAAGPLARQQEDGPLAKPGSPAPSSKNTSGAGLGLYVFALALLAAVGYGVWNYPELQERFFPASPQPVPGGPSITDLAKPSGAPVIDKHTPNYEESKDSQRYVKKAEGMQGLVADPGPLPPEWERPKLTFSGDTGPASFAGRVYKSQKQWDALWRSVGGHDMDPLRDEEMAVAVFAGEQPAGSQVQIVMVETQRTKLVVKYRILRPTRRTGGTTRPYQVVLVPRSDKPVSFRQTR